MKEVTSRIEQTFFHKELDFSFKSLERKCKIKTGEWGKVIKNSI